MTRAINSLKGILDVKVLYSTKMAYVKVSKVLCGPEGIKKISAIVRKKHPKYSAIYVKGKTYVPARDGLPPPPKSRKRRAAPRLRRVPVRVLPPSTQKARKAPPTRRSAT